MEKAFSNSFLAILLSLAALFVVFCPIPGFAQDSEAGQSEAAAAEDAAPATTEEASTGAESTSETPATSSAAVASPVTAVATSEAPPAEVIVEKPSKIDAFRSVTGLENWEYLYDISGYDEGKYNLIIIGTDQAGNEYTEGPFNIYVDPESDLPVVNISNPLPNMRVGGNLNIVGTCVDDDAVERVEVSVNGGPFQLAEGTDYWSFYLNTADMPDGAYPITARGVDVNGLAGRERTVIFHLDKNKPGIRIASHENGVLVNGRVTFQGIVSDLNGIALLEYSTDNSETYESLRFQGDKQAAEVTFQLRVDTLEQADGPQILWFRSTDKMGSVGLAAFLFFIDNKPPELTILYPTEDLQVNGAFTVAGKVSDEVGLESLTWQIGKEEPVVIPLSPGNRYWTQSFDFAGDRQADVLFTLIDKTGNTTTERLFLALDVDGDLPVVTVVSPEAEAIVTEDSLSGFVNDDDGVTSVIYSVDDGDERSTAATLAFDIDLPRLASGSHTISIRGVDENGIEGLPVEVDFTKALGPPEISVSAIGKTSGDPVAFSPGMELTPREHESFQGRIVFNNPPMEAFYSIGGQEPIPLTLKKSQIPTKQDFVIPLPSATIPYGFVKLTIDATDQYGFKSQYATYVAVKNLTRNHADHGIYFHDSRVGNGSRVTKIRPGMPLRGRYIGYPVESVVFDPPTDIVDVVENDGFLEIRARTQGTSESVYLEVRSDRGTVFRTGPFVFETDTTAPRIRLDASAANKRVTGTIQVAGTAGDNVAATYAGYSIGERTVSLDLSGGNGDASFSGNIPRSTMPEEGFLVTYEVRDASGNIARDYRVYNNAPRFVPDPESSKDPSPTVTILYPAEGAIIRPRDLADGRTFVGGVVTGTVGVSQIVYSLDRAEERAITGTEAFEIRFTDLAPGTHSLTVKAVSDKEVEGSTARVSFRIAEPGSVVSLDDLVQADGSSGEYRPGQVIALSTKLSIRGTLAGSSRVSSATYKMDGRAESTLRITQLDDGSRSFTIPIDPGSSLGRHDLEITVTDEFGDVAVTKSFYFLVEPAGDRIISEAEGIFIADVRLDAVDSRPALLGENEEIRAYFNGREITDYRIEPQNDHVSISRIGSTLVIKTGAPGFIDAFTIVVETVDGDQFTAGPFAAFVDTEAPSIKMSNNLTDIWIRDRLTISGEILDNFSVSRFEASAGSRPYEDIPIIPEGEEPNRAIPFELDLPADELPDGEVVLRLRATDAAGNIGVQSFYLRKDLTPPVAEQITPPQRDPVNGRITLAALSVDDGAMSSVEFSDDGETYTPADGTSVFSHTVDLATYEEIPERFYFRLTDEAGNVGEYSPELNLDLESDKPIVEIQIPVPGTLIRSDFVVTGMVFDDDAVEQISYRLDDGEFIPIDGSSSFEISILLEDITDNEHTIDVKAVDLGGVVSEVSTTSFMVSKAEPVSRLVAPAIDVTVQDVVTIRGESEDANGIKEVFISFDNGNTFNRTVGAEGWEYTLDTRTILDGTYSLLIRAVDNTEVAGLYTTLLNVDNTNPTIDLTGPFDGEQVAETFLLQGRATDAIGLQDLHVDIEYIGDIGEDTDGEASGETESGDSSEAPSDSEAPAAATEPEPQLRPGTPVMSFHLPAEEVVLNTVDVSSLAPGWYNVRVTVVDRADNTTYISRNFRKIAAVQYSRIDVLFPAPGERLSGEFSLQGRVETVKPPSRVALYVDGDLYEAVQVNRQGYFSAELTPDRLTDGSHTIYVEARLPDETVIKTMDQRIEYTREGPWVVISNFRSGDFASQRPWIEGRAGYDLLSIPEDEAAAKELRKVHEVSLVEVSLDNGRSFRPVKGKADWKFRLETQDLQDGPLNVLVRAGYRDGSSAVAKTQLVVDDTKPDVRLLSPEEGLRFNGAIALTGTAYDANGLLDVSVALRKGDKNQYEVPEFIQGLYIDTHFLGGTTFEVGAGLTFFDDNVKLQAHVGMSPSGRFSGLVLGAKLLANIAVLPYAFLFGPDWDFLSSGLAIGACFSYFTMSEDSIAFTEEGLVLAAVIGQVELARIQVRGWSVFNAFSAYMEAQFWFISSDVYPEVVPKLSFGLRTEVF